MTKLEQFQSVCYTKDRKKREIPEEQGGGSCMEKKIITISREYGSGGRQIGLVAAKKLGIEFYDKELIDAAAKEIGFPAEIIADRCGAEEGDRGGGKARKLRIYRKMC